MRMLKSRTQEVKILPVERGSIIGWSVLADEYFFCTAVLDYDTDRENLVWHVAGTSKVFTSEEVIHLMDVWEYMGRVKNNLPIPFRKHGKYEKELFAQIEDLEDKINTETNLISWKTNQPSKMSVTANKRNLTKMKKQLSMLKTDLEELLRTNLH